MSNFVNHTTWLALVVSLSFLQSRAETPSDSRKIVVSVISDIPKGTMIKDRYLQEIAIPSKGLPLGIIECRTLAIGRKTKYSLQSGQILQESDLLGKSTVLSSSPHVRCSKFTCVQAKQSIAKGITIQATDLGGKSQSAFDASENMIARPEFVVGFKARTKIEAGQIITREMLYPTGECLKNPDKMKSAFGPNWKQNPVVNASVRQ